MATATLLSNQDLQRLDIINRLIRKQIDGTQAAELLHLSVRQVKRLKAKVLADGPKAIAHASRNQPGHHRIPSAERELISALLTEHYYDFGPALATEKLLELHNIKRNVKTIRSVLLETNLWTSRRKRSTGSIKHRAWRLRRSNYGELIQFDGSYEHWFEDRNGTGEICLLATVDDATGNITSAKFAAHEGVFPVFGFWQEYLLNTGKPVSIYLDKFSTYKMNQRVAIENHDLKTQFQRAMTELHIEPLFANSPQAKGRVERLFGTLQDRLIKELRLQNISDVKSANEFLKKKFIPNFNKRFAVPPRNPANLHKPLIEKEKDSLNSILSKQTIRTVQNDFTVSFKNQWYQILPNQSVTICKRDEIIVEEHVDNTIHFRLRNKYLNTKPITKRTEYSNRTKQPWVIAAGQTNQTTNHLIDQSMTF